MSMWRRFWLTNYYIGMLKYLVYQCGRFIWGYSSWHRIPINWRPYAIHIIETIEFMIEKGVIGNGLIVEVGCGRGDIIGNIKYEKKLGIDIEEKVIDAAKFFYSDTRFLQGEIKDIPTTEIDVLIMAGWMHLETPEVLHNWLSPHLANIKIIVFDVFLDSNGESLSGDRFSHDGHYLFDGNFVLYRKSESEKTCTDGVPCMKHVEYWIRKDIARL